MAVADVPGDERSAMEKIPLMAQILIYDRSGIHGIRMTDRISRIIQHIQPQSPKPKPLRWSHH
ncbi:hypothetical protein BV22DRAFT_1029363 [Leucogyrophana mollusca]|uniref:Uncharacterized protein n=1 Tax=Leucogyrophana mollusca TaxID=85980 RepID=A0ACB8BXE2_9AGAM|nr:hypothetical protein BV22DRAFT_1029363 [Leucogyrophana mollusca]